MWTGRERGRTWRSGGGMRVAAMMLLVMGPLTGCDSGSFTPPRPPELTREASSGPAAKGAAASNAATPGARSRVVELILSLPPTPDRLFLVQFLRRDTGARRCAFRLTAPEKDQPFKAAELAAAIRAAAGRSTGALIVEPIDAPEVRQALADAQAKGLPVILIYRPLPSPTAGKSFPYVTLSGFAEGGHKMVAAVVEDARPFHFPPNATVVVLDNRREDFYGNRCLDAITNALKEAGLKYELVSFDGEQQAAYEALLKVVNSRRVSMVFGEDEYAVSGAFQLLVERYKKHDREFLIGGFAALDSRMDAYAREGSQGLVNRNTEGFARILLDLAIDLMEQRPVPEHTEVDMPFVHTPPPFKPSGDQPSREEAASKEEPAKPAAKAATAKETGKTP